MFCPNCGFENAAAAKFCTKCGAALNAAQKTEEPAVNNDRNSSYEQNAPQSNMSANSAEQAAPISAISPKPSKRKALILSAAIICVLLALAGLIYCFLPRYQTVWLCTEVETKVKNGYADLITNTFDKITNIYDEDGKYLGCNLYNADNDLIAYAETVNDSDGNLKELKYYDSESKELIGRRSFDYYQNGNIHSIYLYQADGELISADVYDYGSNENPNLAKELAANGVRVTETVYNADGKLLSYAMLQDDNVVIFKAAYASDGKTVTVKVIMDDILTEEMPFECLYDDKGNVIKATAISPEGNLDFMENAYDENNNLISKSMHTYEQYSTYKYREFKVRVKRGEKPETELTNNFTIIKRS